MSLSHVSPHIPRYQMFMDSIAVLALPISASELHGRICGYLCAGANDEGEGFLQTLMLKTPDSEKRAAMMSLFDVYATSQHQITNMDFEFQLMLPEDFEPLKMRAVAFSEWCSGFTQGLALSGVAEDAFQDEEAQEALLHLLEFAQLDYEALSIEDEDERALMEVSEYTRMAVLRLYSDLLDACPRENHSQAH